MTPRCHLCRRSPEGLLTVAVVFHRVLRFCPDCAEVVVLALRRQLGEPLIEPPPSLPIMQDHERGP